MDVERIYRSIFEGKKIGPEKVMISPTDFCNLECKICWRREKGGRYDEPSFELIERILRECKELGVKVIDLTGGGEPFLRKDILKIMKLVKRLGFFGTLTTNGTLIDEEKIEEIVKMRWDDIAFSLDGPDRKVNDLVRGDGTFEKCTNTIKNFNKIKRKKKIEFPNLRIATVVLNSNYKLLGKIIELSHSLGINSVYFSTLVEWKSNKKFWIRDEEDVKKYLKKAEKVANQLGVNTNLRFLSKFGVRDHNPPNFCFAPWSMLFINASGDVMVCCTLASLYLNVIGNVKESSLKEIWFGEKMEKFRERVKNKKLFKECRRCIPEFVHKFNETWEEINRCYLKK